MSEELDAPVLRGVGEYWAIAVRRRWWILLPMFFCWIVIWGVSRLLPATYQSESLILVEQQKVPDQYVVPNVTGNLQERLQNLTQQILSRTRLQSTIDRLHLYSGDQRMSKSTDPVEQMRRDIKIDLVSAPDHPGEFTAFKMRYSAGTPELAQKVNAELTSLFIEENVKTQRQLSENTTEFLAAQLADARANMATQESKVAAFKARHLGELPGQLESNVQILAGLQSQRQNAQQTLDAARQQKLYLESLLQQYQSTQSLLRGSDSALSAEQTIDKELLDMQVRLQDLKSRYTDEHPDIVALKDKIAKTERLKKEAGSTGISAQPAGAGQTKTVAGVSTETSRNSSASIMQVQSQLKANQLEIANVQKHVSDIESQIAAYQGRLNLAPETEQGLTAISRGYEESKSNYDSLLQKQMQSQLATSLELRQQGEQFRIVDPPSLPTKLSAPNHLWFSLGGLLAGAGIGLALAVVLEMTNVRIHKEKDLEGLLPVRILVGIPHLTTPGEDVSRLRHWWRELGLATALLLFIVIGNLYAFYKG